VFSILNVQIDGSQLTLHLEASGIDINMGGGLLKPAPTKTHLEAILTQIFHLILIGGQK